MAVIRDVTIDRDAATRIRRLTSQILQECRGAQKVEIEQALLAAYCVVADGVRSMSASTRDLRAAIVAARGARALCDAITEVAALDDATVLMLARTCRE